jgi:hypothetical protein
MGGARSEFGGNERPVAKATSIAGLSSEAGRPLFPPSLFIGRKAPAPSVAVRGCPKQVLSL